MNIHHSILFFSCLLCNSLFGQCEFLSINESQLIKNNHREHALDHVGLLDSHVFQERYNFEGNSLFEVSWSSSLWLGAYGESDDLKIAANQYPNSSNYDFIAGPVIVNPILRDDFCSFYNRAWKINGSQVQRIRLEFELGILNESNIPIDILEWPAIGNPYNSMFANIDFESSAPFFDYDEDGFYNALNGDYPIVLFENPDFLPWQFMYSVYNDNMNTIHLNSFGEKLMMEVHQMDYLLWCTPDALINNAIFTRFKFINKGNEDLKDLKIGIWEDNQLGCPKEDFMGCAPMLNSVFSYDKNGVDAVTGFCEDWNNDHKAVIHSKTYLNQGLKSFMLNYNSDNVELVHYLLSPQSPNEYYQVLSGRWKDGTALTIGGLGYNLNSLDSSRYSFLDSPLDSNGWSMQMDTSAIIYDPVGIATVVDQDLESGQSIYLDMVDFVYYDGESDDLSIYDDWELAIQELQLNFEKIKMGEFECDQLSNLSSQIKEFEIRIFPNPALEMLSIHLSEKITGQIFIRDMQARMVNTYACDKCDEVILDLNGLQSGIYSVQLLTQNGIIYATHLIKQ